MDWKNTNFDWNRARAFLATAEEGSLSAAARALHMTQPTLGRQVDALEEELGVVLFERVGRGLLLTPVGEQLLEHVRKMGEAAGSLSLSALGHTTTLEGSVCITASEMTSVSVLPPIIAKLRRIHPKVEIEILPSNEPKNLRKREADIAIRNFRPEDNDLIAKKIHDERGYFYATPDYLDSLPPITKFEDLAQAEFIGFDHSHEMIRYLNSVGIPVTEKNFPVLAGTHHVHWELTKLGVGIGAMPARLGDLEPKVVRILPEQTNLTYPIWLTTHREVHLSTRVRTVFDFLAEELVRG
ncbi:MULTISPECIES: LysR family transcriptional regulator [unclassified Lentilitoribacter]|uniref:LysR family transcriptional regulator n=1 Tax=unclassified Lentilitoribacter TaxID=2647570 RepID=UPI0013A6DC91|nr:LysR family transcriptional regulator [Lentilitoribacter sp. Alg239-R112]